jgi:hypothetical protein
VKRWEGRGPVRMAVLAPASSVGSCCRQQAEPLDNVWLYGVMLTAAKRMGCAALLQGAADFLPSLAH